jgi:integrase
MGTDTNTLPRPLITPPLNQKKILKARAWVTASGQRWSIGDSKRLRLNVSPSARSGATAAWIFRKQIDGRPRDHGLGSWPETSIEKARELALDAERRIRDTGEHPIDLRKRQKSSAAVARTTQLTFGETATQFFQHKAPSWRSVKTATEWRSTILGVTAGGTPSRADWCSRLRSVLISDISTPMVISALEERWGTATGPRVAAAVSSVFQWALARQLRQPPNPAAWEIISKALASPTKAQHGQFKAMAWKELPMFFAELRARTDIASKALQLLILCASRTKEIRGAAWDEISDLDGAAPLWTVPETRMKNHKPHRVPLSRTAVALLKSIPRERNNPLVFVSGTPGKWINHDAMLRVLAEMGHAGVTSHGFRSCFSDWANESTTVDPLIIEAALSHAAGDQVARKYRRGDLAERRAALMQLWAQYLSGEMATASVTPLYGGGVR